VNLAAVVRILAEDPRPVHLVCAGTDGKITVEDALGAGAIVQRLAEAVNEPIDDWMDDQLQIAVRLYRDAAKSSEAFRMAVRNSSGGRACRRLGFDDQIDRAVTFDLFDIVPEYHAETGRLTP
jgi:2-phosphosulfolactate phosphatase